MDITVDTVDITVDIKDARDSTPPSQKEDVMPPRIHENDAAKKRAYRARKKEKEALSGGHPEALSPSPEAAPPRNRERLEHLADHAKLESDRLRAIDQLTKLDATDKQQQIAEEHSGLVMLKEAMDSLPPGDRLTALDRMLVSTTGDIVIDIEGA